MQKKSNKLQLAKRLKKAFYSDTNVANELGVSRNTAYLISKFDGLNYNNQLRAIASLEKKVNECNELINDIRRFDNEQL